MGELIAKHPWASTRLGPLSAWPQSLKTATSILLRSPLPMALLWGEDGVLVYNDGYSNLIGRRHPEALGCKVLESWPENVEFNGQALRLGLAGGHQSFRDLQFTVYRSGRPEQVWIDVDYSPVPDDSGRPAGVLAICVEVTQQVRAQAALEESNRRLSAAIVVARLGVYEFDLDTGQATLDTRAREIFGFGPDESLTAREVITRIDKDDYQRLLTEFAAAQATGQTRRESDYRIHLPDGGVRNVVGLSDCISGPDGRATRMVGVYDDVTERRVAEQRQRLLNTELNHRVKNTLATVQSIAAQTLRSAPDLQSARSVFETRLVALAAAHELLLAESWQGAGLTEVAATTMAPFETRHRPQIICSGPPVWLTAQRALALSLALHELATNAAKYGALSVPEGRVTIRWSLAGNELRLIWIEDGGPPVAPPTHSGFGTRLLQRSLTHELQGKVAVTFAPEGVRCEIRCEIENVASAATPEIAEA